MTVGYHRSSRIAVGEQQDGNSNMAAVGRQQGNDASSRIAIL